MLSRARPPTRHRPALRRACGLALVALLLGGCVSSEEPGAAWIGFGLDNPTESESVDQVRRSAPEELILATAPELAGYELRQQLALTPESVGGYYHRFPGVAGVLSGFGWESGFVNTFVRQADVEVPPSVTIQVDRFASAEGAARYLTGLRENENPSLSHFLDLAEPARLVDQPTVGEQAVAFEAGLNDRSIVPTVVPVRFYAFRRGPLVAQITVVRDQGPAWQQILALAMAQDARFTSG